MTGAGAGPSSAGRSTDRVHHLAWEVDTLAEIERYGAETLGGIGVSIPI